MMIKPLTVDELFDMAGRILGALPHDEAIDTIIYWLRDRDEATARDLIQAIGKEILL